MTDTIDPIDMVGQVKFDCPCGRSWELGIPMHVAEELLTGEEEDGD